MMKLKDKYTPAYIAIILGIAVSITVLYNSSILSARICLFSTCQLVKDVNNIKTELKFVQGTSLDILHRQLLFTNVMLAEFKEREYKFRLKKEPVPPFIFIKIRYYERQVESIEAKIQHLRMRRG